MANNPNKRYILGGILVLIGGLLVLENLRILDNIFPYYLFDWYSIPLLIGIVLITTRDKVGFGIALTIFGSIFLLEEMSHYYRWRFDFWDVFDFWPIVFIAVGLSLILRKGRHSDGGWNQKKKSLTTPTPTMWTKWHSSEDRTELSLQKNSREVSSLQYLEEQI